MFKLRIASVGKTKEEWLETAIAEYLKRLQSTAAIEFIWFKTDKQLEEWAAKENRVICLDAAGQMMDSEKFSGFLTQELAENGSRLSFIIGGAEGLPQSLRKTPFD